MENEIQHRAPSFTQLDYDTIWLHMKERFWTRAWAIAALTFAGGGLVGFGLATNVVETMVVRYTQTDDFKKHVATLAQEQIPQLTEQVAKLEAREQAVGDKLAARQREIAALVSLPVNITDHSLDWASPQGQRFRIEYGNTKGMNSRINASEVVFEHPFTMPPAVVVTPHEGPLSRERFPLTVSKVSATGFTISGGDGWEDVASWVAFGH